MRPLTICNRRSVDRVNAGKPNLQLHSVVYSAIAFHNTL
jgi:hypothetical protein